MKRPRLPVSGYNAPEHLKRVEFGTSPDFRNVRKAENLQLLTRTSMV